jgi:hypothetical protein
MELRHRAFPSYAVDMTVMVPLSGLEPVAEGGGRHIYFHAAFPEVLFKVRKPRAPRNAKQRLDAFLARRFPSFDVLDLRREMAAYTAARLRPVPVDEAFPASEMRGFAPTDLGVAAQMVERIACDGETLGRTLMTLTAGGTSLPDEQLALLNDFVRRVFLWRIRARDLNARNIVFGARGGTPQFVLVDGLGDMNVIPLRTWSDSVNRLELNKSFAWIGRQTGLHWEPRTSAFSRR